MRDFAERVRILIRYIYSKPQAISIIKYSVSVFAGVILTLLLLPFFQRSANAPAYVPDVIIPVSLTEQEAALGALYDKAAPSVVSINFALRFEDDFIYTPISSGSGFIISEQGYIVTNAHVLQVSEDIRRIIEAEEVEISDARVEVRMFDGTITPAEIIGIDSDSDLAVIQVDVPISSLTPIAFADSNALRVGETVLAIGNPFSNDWTMTSGIISALNRSIPGLEGYSIGGVIQTDTAINPGNSGGPLVNLDGEVIGVNSQINTESGTNSGIGFAVPSNLVNKVVTSLIETGTVEYSFIGIQRRQVDLDLINAFDLPNNLRGVAVLVAIPNTPAANAGLRSLSNRSVDVITAIDGTPIADFDELLGYLALNTVPGDAVTLTVYRDNAYLELPLTLTNRPSITENIAGESDDSEATEDTQDD
ncbi:MAG: trypsin-like peptidase domain-containing protein [Phototrophicaceae bacterium]